MTEYEHDHESPREERANAITHGIGALASLVGGSVLVTLAAAYGNGWQLGASIVFGVSLLLLYLASTLYHALPNGRAKRVFLRLDYCAIFLFIAGSYTPFALGALSG